MGGDFLGQAVKTLVLLVVFSILVFAVVLLLKRFRGVTLSTRTVTEARIVSTLPLPLRKSVVIVEVKDRLLVLGVGTETVTLLEKIEAPPITQPTGDESMEQGVVG